MISIGLIQNLVVTSTLKKHLDLLKAITVQSNVFVNPVYTDEAITHAGVELDGKVKIIDSGSKPCWINLKVVYMGHSC